MASMVSILLPTMGTESRAVEFIFLSSSNAPFEGATMVRFVGHFMRISTKAGFASTSSFIEESSGVDERIEVRFGAADWPFTVVRATAKRGKKADLSCMIGT